MPGWLSRLSIRLLIQLSSDWIPLEVAYFLAVETTFDANIAIIGNFVLQIAKNLNAKFRFFNLTMMPYHMRQ